MDTLNDLAAARRAVRLYLPSAQGHLPDDTFAQLESIVDESGPIDVIALPIDFLYARRPELDNTARTLVAQLATFATPWGFHDLNKGDRGPKIIAAMQRDIAAGKVDARDDDAVPLMQYVRPATAGA